MRFKLDCLDNRGLGDRKAINKIFIVMGEAFLLTYFFIGVLNLYSLKSVAATMWLADGFFNVRRD